MKIEKKIGNKKKIALKKNNRVDVAIFKSDPF